MRKNYETSKLYYGFPVILLGYKDANFKYNFTTNSSSYTLGDMMVIGLHCRSNAAKQIMNFKEFTVTMECKVENVVMYGETANIIASIKKRVVNPILIEDGKLNSDKLNSVLFFGDDNEKIYRYLRNLSDKAGKFYKNKFE